MRRIGSRKVAKILFDAVTDAGGIVSVEGFTILGTGCDRTAYLHDETQVVYKVTNRRDRATFYPQSQREYAASRRLAGTHRHGAVEWIIPIVSKYVFGPGGEHNWVLATTFSPNVRNWDAMRAAQSVAFSHGWADIYGDNVGQIGKAYVVRDLGCFYHDSRPFPNFEKAS